MFKHFNNLILRVRNDFYARYGQLKEDMSDYWGHIKKMWSYVLEGHRVLEDPTTSLLKIFSWIWTINVQILDLENKSYFKLSEIKV